MNRIKIIALTFVLIFSFLVPNFSFAKSDPDKVNYELPYPGLLPDNPLYFLRIIRDKTVGFLISAPLKKAEFDLLQADKRLNAGIQLFNSAKQNEKKMKLALSTISKAENYFEAAIQKVKEGRKQGMETRGIINKLINSSKKHQEVLSSFQKKAAQNFRPGFDLELQRAVSFEKEVISLTLK